MKEKIYDLEEMLTFESDLWQVQKYLASGHRKRAIDKLKQINHKAYRFAVAVEEAYTSEVNW